LYLDNAASFVGAESILHDRSGTERSFSQLSDRGSRSRQDCLGFRRAIKSDLDHFQYETFVVKFGRKTRLTFCPDIGGNVSALTVNAVEFKRLAAPAAPAK
jgi:hypothetical protein